MAVGVGDWGDRDFWKEVAMELESGQLSEWREDRLLEPGAGDCSGEAVEVEDFFLWDDMDGVIYCCMVLLMLRMIVGTMLVGP